jgi:hypothetical protein
VEEHWLHKVLFKRVISIKKTEKAIPSSEGFVVNTVSSDDGQFFGFYTMQCIWFVPLFQRKMLPLSSGLIRIRWILK